MKIKQNDRGDCFVDLETEFGTRKLFIGTKDPTDAVRLLEESNIELGTRLKKVRALRARYYTLEMNGKEITLAQAAMEWREKASTEMGLTGFTIRNYYQAITSWLASTRKTGSSPASIEIGDVLKYIYRKDDSSLSHRSVALYAIKHFVNFLEASNYIPFDFTKKLRKVDPRNIPHRLCIKRERRIFTDAEFQKLMASIQAQVDGIKARINAMKPEWRVLNKKTYHRLLHRLEIHTFWIKACLLSRHGGFRLGDICRLEWSCFNSCPGHIELFTAKRGALVRVPIQLFGDGPLADVIASLEPNDSGYVFPMYQELYENKRTAARVNDYFLEHLRRAGMFGLHTFHDLRATFIKECIDKKLPVAKIAEIVGHSRPYTTVGYVPRNQRGDLPKGVTYVTPEIEEIEAKTDDPWSMP